MATDEYKKGYDAAVEAMKKALQNGLKPSTSSGSNPQPNGLNPLPFPVTGNIKDILKNRKINLPKNLADMPMLGDQGNPDIQKKEAEERAKNAEFDDLGNNVNSANYTKPTSDEVEAHLQQLKDLLYDPATRQGAFDDTARIKNKIAQTRAARDAEMYRNSPLAKFKESFKRFIRDAVSDTRDGTWKKINKNYAASSIIKKGITSNSPNFIPTIFVYFDLSGSWTDEKVAVGEQAVATINMYVKQKKVVMKLFYFSNHVHTDREAARKEGGTCGQPILDHIKQNKPNNVIIMTDSDITDCTSNVEVPGAVWLLFQDGISPNLQEHIHGKKLTRWFEIDG